MTLSRSRTGADFILQSVDGKEQVYCHLANVPGNFRVSQVELTPPQISDGTAVGYDSIDPQNDLVVQQSSWANGAGLDLHRANEDSKDRYGLGSNVVSLVEGSISSGYPHSELDVSLPAGDLATNAQREWKADPFVLGGEYYAAYGSTLYRYDGANHEMDVVDTFTHPIQSMAVFDGKVYVTFTSGTQYAVLSGTNLGTDVRKDSPLSGIVNCIRAKSAAGTFVLVMANDDDMRVSSNPGAATPVWSDALAVGPAGGTLVSLALAKDTLYIGKSTGLWQYDTSGDGEFVNLEPEIGFTTSELRYRSMVGFADSLFATYTGGGVWQIQNPTSGPQYINLRSRFNFYNYEGRNGQVRSLQNINAMIWALGTGKTGTLGFPYSFPVSLGNTHTDENVIRLLAYDPQTNRTHELMEPELTVGDRISRHVPDDASVAYVFLMGSIYNGTAREPKVIRLELPLDDIVPHRALRSQSAQKGWFVTQWFDNFFPDVRKLLTKVTLYCDGLSDQDITEPDASSTLTTGAWVRVDYQTDAEPANTWRYLGHVTRNEFFDLPIHEDRLTYFEDPVKYKRIRFRFYLEHSGGEHSISIEQFVMHSSMTNVRLREYEAALEYVEGFQRQSPSLSLAELYKLQERYDVLRMVPVSDRLGWLTGRLVRIRQIEPGAGEPLQQGEITGRQRNVVTRLAMIDLVDDNTGLIGGGAPVDLTESEVRYRYVDRTTQANLDETDTTSDQYVLGKDYGDGTSKFISQAERSKLAGLPSSIGTPTQSDWNNTNVNSLGFIRNKPNVLTTADIPNITVSTDPAPTSLQEGRLWFQIES